MFKEEGCGLSGKGKENESYYIDLNLGFSPLY